MRSLEPVLLQRRQKALNTLKSEANNVLATQADEAAYLSSLIDRSKAALPQMDFDNIEVDKTDARTAMLKIPFKDKMELLQYLPKGGSVGLLSRHFPIKGEYVCFEVERIDSNLIEQKKDLFVSILKPHVEAARAEIEDHNRGLTTDLKALFDRLKADYQKDNEELEKARANLKNK
jgi:hypothetical protein